MYTKQEHGKKLYIEMSSDLSYIDRLIDDCEGYYKEIESLEFSPMIQILRELLLNAIEHGNRMVKSKRVFCVIENICKNRYKISITDEGGKIKKEMFEQTELAGPGKERSYGIQLINNYSDEVIVDEEYSTVIVYLTLMKKMNWKTVKKDNVFFIEPSKDISAGFAEDMKSVLGKWLDMEMSECNLSLKNVRSIDSISLSLLISFYKVLEKKSGKKKFKICNVDPEIMQLFDVTQLGRLFEIEVTV